MITVRSCVEHMARHGIRHAFTGRRTRPGSEGRPGMTEPTEAAGDRGDGLLTGPTR
ncbi:hypothetical protein ACHL6L_27890 [Amycolatopsis sp. A24]|uniref:hypothetical protein n=1 Tax=Amycolatopsis sp. A24 TaxID=3375097 RepID=UPI0039ED3FC8